MVILSVDNGTCERLQFAGVFQLFEVAPVQLFVEGIASTVPPIDNPLSLVAIDGELKPQPPEVVCPEA
jgi:hypothetical protein